MAAWAAAWALLRLLEVGWGTPFVQVISFTPYAVVVAATFAVLCLLLRHRAAAAVTLVAALVLGALVAPRLIAGGSPADGGRIVRVMTVNLRLGAADPDAVVALVRTRRIDVLALQEFTGEAERALDAAGLGALLPHQSRAPRGLALGSAVYSRLPLTATGSREQASGFWQAYGTVIVPGGARIRVESAHPRPPIGRGYDRSWRRDLRDQPRADGSGGEYRLLLGDFNSTLDHAPLLALLASGYRDAAEMTGRGLSPTWPADRWWFPGLVLDHVLVGPGVGVRAHGVDAVTRSDHRAVFAELVLLPR